MPFHVQLCLSIYTNSSPNHEQQNLFIVFLSLPRGKRRRIFHLDNLFAATLRNRLLNESLESPAVSVVLWNIEFLSFIRKANKHSTNFVYSSFTNKSFTEEMVVDRYYLVMLRGNKQHIRRFLKLFLWPVRCWKLN